MEIESLEDIIVQLGSFGPLQLFILTVLNFAETPCAWAILLMAFAGAKPEWTCSHVTNTSAYNVSNDAVMISPINVSSTCDALGTLCPNAEFHEDFHSVVSQWQLVCDKDWLPSVTVTVQMAGVMLGATLAGILGDNIGRKKTFFSFYAILLLFCFFSAFVNCWIIFTLFRFVIGACVGGVLVANYSLPMEFVGLKWRTLTGAIPFWAMGVMSLGLAAFLLPDWRHLSMATAIVGLPVLFTWWFQEAEKVLQQVARWNKRPVPDVAILQTLAAKEQKKLEGKKRYTYLDLFRSRVYVRKSLVIGWIWFNCGMVYYGLSFGVQALAGNPYLNIFISGAVEAPAVLSVIYFNNCAGRRPTALVYSLISGIASLCVIIVTYTGPEDQIPSIISGLAMSAKLGIAGAWIAVQVFTAETYPTCIRNLGYGYACIMTRIGSIFAPSIIKLGTYSAWLPYLIFSIGMVSSGLVLLLLPETNNRPLKEYLGLAKEPRHEGPCLIVPVINPDINKSTNTKAKLDDSLQ